MLKSIAKRESLIGKEMTIASDDAVVTGKPEFVKTQPSEAVSGSTTNVERQPVTDGQDPLSVIARQHEQGTARAVERGEMRGSTKE